MRRTLFCIGTILMLSIGAFAQKERTEPAQAVMLESGTRIEGQLQSTIDVKRARVGDQVVLKTTKDIKQKGQTVVPKGSQLIGRVTQVQQRTKQNTVSRLGLVFDRIKGQNLSAPITASIVNVTNAAANANVGSSSADADIFGSSNTSTRSSSGASGGGLLGGVTNTVGGVLSTTASTAGSVTDTVGNTVGSTARTVGQTTSGLHISNSASGSAQTGTTLTAADRNIRLEKGATIQLKLNSAARAQ
jgi:hypothetical protein